jgi:FAD/FMN-containing dehydrogenase
MKYEMTTNILDPEIAKTFRTSLRGTIIQPGDESYEGARKIWNGMIDKRPAAIVRCTGASDVMAAVRFAREHRLPIAVRCGGHNVAGNSVCDGGIVIDLGPMRMVRVDPSRSVVRVAGGALLGDIDHETQAFGLAVPVGAVSTTGIGGLALHGGLGFLTRKYGLTADNLVSADIVTADGSLVTADETNNSDLFWALGGAMGRVPPDTTPFFHRKSPWLLTIEANSSDPATDEANIAWVRSRFDEAQRFTTGGTYFNFAGFLEGGEELLAKSFGENYNRIREVKTKYDPENIFNHNLRIPTIG